MSKNQEQLQAIIDSITAFLSFDQFCVTAWQSGLQTKIQLYSGPTSAVLLIPASSHKRRMSSTPLLIK